MSRPVDRARVWRDHRWAPRRMSAYLDDELASSDRVRLERHSAECPECRRVLRDLRRMLYRLHRLPAARTSDASGIAAAVAARLHEPPHH